MKKIGIVCHPSIGGSGIVATELGLELLEHDFEVHFISYKMPYRLNLLHSNIYFHQVEIENYPLFEYQPYELTLATKIREVALEHKLDLLHVHYAIPHAYSAYFAKQMLLSDGYHLPFITTLHGTDITLVGLNENYRPAVSFCLNNSDAITSVSESLKKDTLELFNIKDKKIEVISNFINHCKFTSKNTKKDCTKDPKDFILCHISNLRKVKQPLKVVETFSKVQKVLPNAKLFLVGNGSELLSIENYVKKLKLHDNVKFFGDSTQIYDILCVSDIFILPSTQESFGLAALEAMAAKTPVISSNIGGLPEINIHGETGYLYEPNDSDAMAQSIIDLLQNPKLLEKMKTQAYEQSLKFCVTKVVNEYISLYEEVISRKNK